MKVLVIFDYPGVDSYSPEADDIIDCLESELEDFAEDTGNICYVEGIDTTED